MATPVISPSVSVIWRVDNFGHAMNALKRADSEKPTELAHVLVSYAKSIVPVRTGDLRDSIVIREGTTSFVDVLMHYGGFVEFGTVNMAARPYLRPAFQKMLAEVPSRYRGLFVGFDSAYYGHSAGDPQTFGPGQPPTYGYRDLALTPSFPMGQPWSPN